MLSVSKYRIIADDKLKQWWIDSFQTPYLSSPKDDPLAKKKNGYGRSTNSYQLFRFTKKKEEVSTSIIQRTFVDTAPS